MKSAERCQPSLQNYLHTFLDKAALVAILGCFLPFMGVSALGQSFSISLFQGGDGIILLVLLIAASALLYFKKYLVTLILSILSLLVIVFDFFNASQYARYGAKHGLGAYLVLLGCIVGVAMAVSIFTNHKKK